MGDHTQYAAWDEPSMAPLTIDPAMAARARQAAAAQQPAAAAPSRPAPVTGDLLGGSFSPPSHVQSPPPPPPPPPPAAAPVSSGGETKVDQLAAMFPDLDKDVLATVLSMSDDNIEHAITQLLEMSDPNGGGGGGGGGSGGGGNLDAAAFGVDSDEELALSLFQQFAGAHK